MTSTGEAICAQIKFFLEYSRYASCWEFPPTFARGFHFLLVAFHMPFKQSSSAIGSSEFQTFFAFTWRHRRHLEITIFFFDAKEQIPAVLGLNGIIRVCKFLLMMFFADFKSFLCLKVNLKDFIKPRNFR